MASILKLKGLSKSSRYRIRTRARKETNKIMPILYTTHLGNNTVNIVNEDVNSIYDIPDQLNDSINVNEDQDTSKNASIYIDSEQYMSEIEYSSVDDISTEMSSSLHQFLCSWGVKYNINHEALSELLKGLRVRGHSDLPACAKTLLRTPKSILIRPINGGDYHNIGISTEIQNLASKNVKLPDVLHLNIGIDGLPISKSTSDELWPILGLFVNVPKSKVFLIGIFHGKSKPKMSNEYLSDFVNEIIQLINEGIQIGERQLKIKFNALVADAPAKAFLLNIKGHNSFDGCSKCHAKGFWLGKVCFPITVSKLRSHESFTQYSDRDYHKQPTILDKIPEFSLVDNVVLDYMHLVLEGVVQKIILYWISTKHPTRLSTGLITEMNERLSRCAMFIPREFQRSANENSRTHPFSQANRWKATESRQFLLYTSFLCLKGLVSNTIMEHFFTLSIAMRILLSPTLYLIHNEYADKLLCHFVSQFENVYGRENISYNVHGLLHLAGEAKRFGPLDTCCAFPFESFMQMLKKYTRSLYKPLQQISRRYCEIKKNEVISIVPNTISSSVTFIGKITSGGSLMIGDAVYPQYSGLNMDTLCIRINKKDRYVKMKDKSFVEIETIATSKKTGDVIIIGRPFENVSDWFTNPCKSSYVGIYFSLQTGPLKQWNIDEIVSKVICFPAGIVGKPGSVLITLVHHI